MAIKFQYNKVSLQEIEKQLKVRLEALPVIKFKEAILRTEAEKAKKKMVELENKIAVKIKNQEYMNILWQEFPQDLAPTSEIKTILKNIAGVKTSGFEDVEFNFNEISLFNQPFWISDGIALLKELGRLSIEIKLLGITRQLLEAARKKTTQKVNLYEKVQVPGYLNAISKIQKYINDEESLGKAAQKLMKKRILSI